MTLPDFSIYKNIQSFLGATKSATKTSVLQMRQQLIFLENESYTSSSMAKPKTKAEIKI